MPPDSAQRPSTPSLRGPSGGVPRFLGAGDFVYRSQPVPVFQDAHGTRLRDADGRTHIDAEGANETRRWAMTRRCSRRRCSAGHMTRLS
jgi:hypothetical protein